MTRSGPVQKLTSLILSGYQNFWPGAIIKGTGILVKTRPTHDPTQVLVYRAQKFARSAVLTLKPDLSLLAITNMKYSSGKKLIIKHLIN